MHGEVLGMCRRAVHDGLLRATGKRAIALSDAHRGTTVGMVYLADCLVTIVPGESKKKERGAVASVARGQRRRVGSLRGRVFFS